MILLVTKGSWGRGNWMKAIKKYYYKIPVINKD